MNKGKNLNKIYLLILTLFMVFGTYKNGIVPYTKGLIPFIGIFKPAIIVMMGLIANVLARFVKYKDIKKTIEITSYIDIMMVTMMLPIKSSPIIILLVVFLWELFTEKLSLNRMALLYIILLGINQVLGLNIFANTYELSTKINYDLLDRFAGYNIGGVCSTSILIASIGLILLSTNKLYKKDMVYSALLSFILICSIPSIINNNYMHIFDNIFSYNIIFGIIILSPFSNISSYTTKGQILSGVILGIISYLLSYPLGYYSIGISILIIGLIRNICDRFFIVLGKK